MADAVNYMHLYTGAGKGKTTAAMGLALRALGQGHRVLVAQFMKTGHSGERAALAQVSGALLFDVEPIGKFTFQMTPEEFGVARERQKAQLERLIDAIASKKPGLMVFDELAVSVARDVIDEEDAWRLIETGLQFGEVVVTGRDAPVSFLSRADYVTEMKKIRHPYDRGIKARRGVEF